MGWFGRKAAEAPRPAVPLWLSGEAESVPRSYQARLGEVFVGNPVGQRAVRMVAGAVGALPVYAIEGKERAAELASRAGLMETVASQLMLHGNTFLQCVVGHDRMVHELFPLRPERVSLELDERGWPAAYAYKVKNRSIRIAARDALGRAHLIHLKSLNPGDDRLGLGCMDAAIAAAAVHNRATRFHNEALQRLDLVVQPVVEGEPSNEPPADPQPGQAFLVGVSPAGAWSGHAGVLTCWTDGGWRFIEAFEGMEVSTRTGLKLRYAGGSWEAGKLLATSLSISGQQVVGPRGGAISDPAGGPVVDQQARAAVVQILSSLRHHGLIGPS